MMSPIQKLQMIISTMPTITMMPPSVIPPTAPPRPESAMHTSLSPAAHHDPLVAGRRVPRRLGRVCGCAPGYDSGMIGFIIAGLIIGALARWLLPGRQKIGLVWTLALGVAGSVIGGTVANLIGTGDIMELNVIGFIVAVVASVALLAAGERAGLGQGDDRKRLSRG